jgi:hypothetical protein
VRSRPLASEARTFDDGNLSTVDYAYLWADGVHLNVRLDEDNSACSS